MSDWLHIARGDAPLIVAFPHTGADLPEPYRDAFVSPWLARLDADWHVEALYDFAHALGATTVRTTISRSIIDVNRDPSGASLYPGQATTALCPLTTFDGAPLYKEGREPDAVDIETRRARWFSSYHVAIESEIARLRERHSAVIVYDAHSIRSRVPRLFDGALPMFNIGTNNGETCAPALREAVTAIARASGESYVVDGRFRGGWTTRHYGRPAENVHAIQMELAQRAYLHEPDNHTPETWPAPIDLQRAEKTRAVLRDILCACIAFAEQQGQSP